MAKFLRPVFFFFFLSGAYLARVPCTFTVWGRAHMCILEIIAIYDQKEINVVLTFPLYSVSIPCRVLKSFRGHPPLREWKGS